MGEDLTSKIEELALKAKEASVVLSRATEDQRNDALHKMGQALRDNIAQIIEANEKDMDAAKKSGEKESILDRLMLNDQRINDMADALDDLASLKDPIGVVLEQRELYNGINLQRVSVPLGVVAVVFEARPNVSADAAGICIKSGNACILRGGSLAFNSNNVIAEVLSDAVVAAGLPKNSISNIASKDRAATDALMQLHGIVDVLIPRGGAGLIKHCVEASKIPVIETGTGNCHVYVHETADIEMAKNIVKNSKCRRYGVCNAAETLLVDSSIAKDFMPQIAPILFEHEVVCHCDEESLGIIRDSLSDTHEADIEDYVVPATPQDWDTEYLAPEISIKCVSGVEDAIDHINQHGTHHSESIVTEDETAKDLFTKWVDSAAVYVNASTAFTDGAQFGLGAEIGISTQKLHVRGPFALEALTSSKYVLEGSGQTRE